MWLKVLRQNITHLARKARGSASIETKNGNGSVKGSKTNNNGAELNRNEDQTLDLKSQAKKKPTPPGGGSLLQQAETSSSQLDFFKMLDEKIENGPDYDETADPSARAERVTSLLRNWELASVTDMSSSPSDYRQTTCLSNRHNLSAKDREGMRNIIGGRPESAPVFIRNAVNRVDGLQDASSPHMPRHVLESITQSPTQSRSTPPTASPMSYRYQDDYYSPQAPRIIKSDYQNRINGDFVTQQSLYREQYLQQTGIMNSPAFAVPRKQQRDFKSAQMT